MSATLAGCDVSRFLSGSLDADDGVLRALRVNHDECIGCFLCVEACRDVEERRAAERGISPTANTRDRSLISIHSFLPGPYHVVWACLGCPDIPCVRACDYYAEPLGHLKALHVDRQSGAITLEREACAGCERCIEACARDGADVLYWDDEAYIAGACHLCDGRPECAIVCPVNAIDMIEVDRAEALDARTPEQTAREGIRRTQDRDVEPERLAGDGAPLRALRVNHDRCTGCRLCEAACDERNNPVRLAPEVELPGPGDTTRSLINVHRIAGPYYVAWACLGCPDLPCVAACEAEAYGEGQRRAWDLDPATGALRLAPEFCTSCQACIDACRCEGAGVLRWDPAEYVLGACHLCGGDPACVGACPFDAIELVTVDRTQPLEPRTVEEVARVGYERVYGSSET